MANNILEMALEQLDFPPSTISAWFDDVTVVSFGDNRLVLHSPVPFKKEFIESKFIAPLQEVLHNLTGDPITIVVVTGEYTAPSTSTSPYDDYTFERFIVGSSNKFAHAAALAVSQRPAAENNPLFIYGNSGLGKTHLLNAIQIEIHKNHPDYNIVYVDCEKFTNEIITAVKMATTEQFRQKYREADVLLIDDIQFLAGKESTQEEFFHTFNTLHNAGKQIVLASDRPAKEIKSLEERLRTRFEWGLTADVQPPDFETRVAIVKRKAELLHLDLPEDVAEFIANHLKNNIRQLEGAVKKLNAYYMLEGIQPVISVAQNAIKDILNETQPVPVTIEKIVGEVSRTFNVSPADIRGTKRNANVASARRVAIYILREVTGMSMEEIGREFSGRDHSTIVYSLKTMERDMKNDQHLRETVSDIIKNVKA